MVDGHNLLFQMFFGMPARILGRNGKPIQGVVGFVGAVNRLLRQLEPDYAAVLFDREQPNPRQELLEDYKANRQDFSDAPEEDNPFSQLPYIYEALDCMGLKHREIPVYEADDGFSALCLGYGGNHKIVISSFDSDLFQLIGPNVSVLRYRGKASTLMDQQAFRDKFGIEPEYYADWKALVGDNSDHIRGVPGVGPKTAAALIREFGGLVALRENIPHISREKLRDALSESWDLVERNYRLIKLDDRCPIPFTLPEMKYYPRDFRTMEILREIGL